MRGLPRALELPLAVFGLGLSLPLVGPAALAILLTSPGPLLYRQQRLGRGGRPFTLYKLRTMRAASGGTSVTVAGDPRVTGVGGAIRWLKIDELPQLWNVVRGEMSLVGPRPEVPRYVDPGHPLWRPVLAARPGLTDPVAIDLRHEDRLLAAAPGDPEELYRSLLLPYKLHRQAAYLARRTAWSDLVVLVRTVATVLRPALAHPPSWEEIRAVAGASGGAEHLVP